jgi:serine/threonine-protein kinase
MLAGEPPFTGDSPLSVAVSHLNKPAPPLTRHRPDLPSRFADVIERMLAKQPADRYANPAALLADLLELSNEGAEQGWISQPVNWSLAETIRAADDRSEATARLESLMKTSVETRPKRSSAIWLAAWVAGCVLLGIGAAALMRPPQLLRDAPYASAGYGNVWTQLLHAKKFNTEAAWLAAVNHPGADPKEHPYHSRLARKGLAYYYLTRGQDYEKAIKPLQELAQLGESQPASSTFGIAGNSRLTPEMRVDLQEDSPQMADLLEEAIDHILYSE